MSSQALKGLRVYSLSFAVAILAFIIVSPALANTYYLAPASAGGNDSNTGLSANSPWRTPNHSVNCGDVLLAAPGIYADTDFDGGRWGTVTCAAGNNVAWVKCATFDACRINGGLGHAGIDVSNSYWGVQGWEVTVSDPGSPAGCFLAVPYYLTQVSVHHIIFANNVANGCYAGGFGAGLSTTGSADYVAIVGNVVYNAAAGGNCYSNINVFQPHNYDSQPGTHIYVAGNVSFGALNTKPCGGGIPSDGEGINIDSLNASGGVGTYTGQVVVDNNIAVANGGRGIEVEYNQMGSPGAVYLLHNTQWGNSLDANQVSAWCGDQLIAGAYNVQSSYNLVESVQAKGCSNNPVYALQVVNGNGTDQVDHNWAYSNAGNNVAIATSSTFALGLNNLLGADPVFANPVAPGAPNCSGYANAPSCMSTVIANFMPKNSAASAYGYQQPASDPIYDPLFPAWLCTSSLPSGLITMGCLPETSSVGPPTIISVTVQ